MNSFSVYSLGCKLNSLESEAIADSFCREGFSLLPWQASGLSSILIINTCTVTSMADQKARRVIRKVLRERPEACVLITGCYAQLDKAALTALAEEIPGSERRLFVIPSEKKDSLLDLPRFIKETCFQKGNLEISLPDRISSFFAEELVDYQGDGSFRYKPEKFSFHSRSFLKIQDGCDRSCSYCRVSIARGKSRSLGKERALDGILSLEERCFSEAVLTGVNICQYSDGETGLAGLLNFLLEGSKNIRLRLSSIEPEALDGDLIPVLKNPRIRPHFHLSVQSGSAAILEKMGRPYSPACVNKAIHDLRAIRDDPFLACDIIAGFPGESEKHFEETYELCEKAGFAWIHAFPFSPRPGTVAYTLPGGVNEREVSRRAERLVSLAGKGRRDYVKRWAAREVEAIIETSDKTTVKKLPQGYVPATSENYLKLLVFHGREPAPAPGSLVRCRIQVGIGTATLPSAFDAFADFVGWGQGDLQIFW